MNPHRLPSKHKKEGKWRTKKGEKGGGAVTKEEAEKGSAPLKPMETEEERKARLERNEELEQQTRDWWMKETKPLKAKLVSLSEEANKTNKELWGEGEHHLRTYHKQ